MAKKLKRVVPIGDTHFPFHSKECLTWITDSFLTSLEHRNPYAIVMMGDLYDLISYYRFPKRLSITPADELGLARATAEEFFFILRKRCPRSKIFLIRGNHDERAAKQVLTKAPEYDALLNMLGFKDLWTFDGVETLFDTKEALFIDDIAYIHGHTKHGNHLAQLNYPDGLVHGHDHTGNTSWRRVGQVVRNKFIARYVFEHGCGFLGDPFHEALIYRPMAKYFKWTLGVSEVVDKVPTFYPFRGAK